MNKIQSSCFFGFFFTLNEILGLGPWAPIVSESAHISNLRNFYQVSEVPGLFLHCFMWSIKLQFKFVFVELECNRK